MEWTRRLPRREETDHTTCYKAKIQYQSKQELKWGNGIGQEEKRIRINNTWPRNVIAIHHVFGAVGSPNADRSKRMRKQKDYITGGTEAIVGYVLSEIQKYRVISRAYFIKRIRRCVTLIKFYFIINKISRKWSELFLHCTLPEPTTIHKIFIYILK